MPSESDQLSASLELISVCLQTNHLDIDLFVLSAVFAIRLCTWNWLNKNFKLQLKFILN